MVPNKKKKSNFFRSLGCTIIELLTGVPPYFELPGMAAIFRMVQDECPPLPLNISSDLEDFLRKCFQKDPLSRPTADVLLCHPWIRKLLRKLKKTKTVDEIEIKLKTYNNKKPAITLRCFLFP
jgi:serine/threonine protein kinase